MSEHREDGSHPRQRSPGGDGFDSPCTGARPSPHDVVVEEHDKRLARRHPGAGRARGSDEAGTDAQDEKRRRRHRNPPANARGSRSATGGVAHPVNDEGPRRGWSTAAAQAR